MSIPSACCGKYPQQKCGISALKGIRSQGAGTDRGGTSELIIKEMETFPFFKKKMKSHLKIFSSGL